MTRLVLTALFAIVLCADPLLATAQPRTSAARIGVLWGGETSFATPYIEAGRRAMAELGYVEGRDFVAEVRLGERKPGAVDALAADLADRRVDVIIAAVEKEVFHAPWTTIHEYFKTAGFRGIRRRKFNCWFPALLTVGVA